MTVLAVSKDRPVKLPAGGLDTFKLPLAGYTNFASGSTAHAVYKGSLVICDVSDTDGYFRAIGSGVNAASGDMPGGIAMEEKKVTASDLADGSVWVTVARNGIWGFAQGSIAQTDVGAVAYASDDDTITTTSSNNYVVGRIVGVSDGLVWIDISRTWMVPQ